MARTLAILTALAAGGGVALQFWLTITDYVARGDGVAAALLRLFSFFTIWTNLAIAALAVLAAVGAGRALWRLALLPSAIVTGLLYTLLLRGDGTGDPLQLFASSVLHDVSPVLFGLMWLALPHGGLGLRAAAAAMILPLLYMIYGLARGAIDGTYVYWFLNPTELGWSLFLRNGALMLAGFAALGLGLVLLDRILARPRRFAEGRHAG